MSDVKVARFRFLVTGFWFAIQGSDVSKPCWKPETRNQKPETLNSEVLSVACARQSPILSLSSERNA